MESKFAHLKWDTQFFGFGVGCILPAELNELELSKILQSLRADGYRLIYWRLLSGQQESSCVAKAQGGFLAAEQLTYARELTGLAETQKTYSAQYRCIPYLEETPDAEMITLAIQAGEYSRFRRDPIFPRASYEKLFTTWITRSVKREIAREVLVIKNSGDTLGMITLGNCGDRGDIGLVAVAESARGVGVGRALVSAANNYFVQRNYTHSQVVTQRENVAACRLYEACGYHIEKSENVFHYWL